MTRSRGFLTFPLAGPRIRELREGHYLSTAELGRLLGVSDKTVLAYERGKSQPSFYQLIRLSRYFRVPLAELAGENVEGVSS